MSKIMKNPFEELRFPEDGKRIRKGKVFAKKEEHFSRLEQFKKKRIIDSKEIQKKNEDIKDGIDFV